MKYPMRRKTASAEQVRQFKQTIDNPGRRPLTNIIYSELEAMIASLVTAIFVQPRKHLTCKYYGHVIDKASWRGEWPKCADCGEQVRSVSQLRRCTIN